MMLRTILVPMTAVALLAGAAPALEVQLVVTDTVQAARSATPITSGIPFARGAVTDVGKLAVKMDGKVLPAQFLKTVPWDDGSVRWALMDVQVDLPATGKADLVVTDAGGNTAPATPVKVEDGADAVKVSTGPLEFVIGKKKPGLFESIKVDGQERLSAAGRGLVVTKADGGEVVAAAPTEVKLEQAGPLRAVVCVRGKYPELNGDMLGYTARITAYAGRKHVKVHVWLENRGGLGCYRSKSGEDEPHNAIYMDWFFFKGMAVELGLGLGDAVVASCEGADVPAPFKVSQTCNISKAQAKVQYKRAPLYTFKDLEYVITGAGKEVKTGDRTDGVVALKGSQGTLTTAIRDFWQNYEKAIETDGKTLKLWLWPVGGQYPRAGIKHGFGEIFDKKLVDAQLDGGYQLEGAVHKGYEIALDFSGRPAAETQADLGRPLFALASGEYYAATAAATGIFAPASVRTGDRDCDAKLTAWNRSAKSAADPASPTSIYRARAEIGTETTYWYGWMDFGDLCIPGHGQASLAFDWPWILLVNAMRSGDVNSLRLATDMMHHRLDVDTLWSDRDLAEIRGMVRNSAFIQFHCGRLRWVPPASGNNLPGVVQYYMLTGEPKALECALLGGEGLKAVWKWTDTAKPYGGPHGDMMANAFSMQCYVALYDLTADKKWLDEAMALFRNHVIPKWQGAGPHLHDANGQIQFQDYIKEDYKYCCAIQGLCELARVVPDEKLLELIKAGAEKELPVSTFFDAPLYYSGQLAFMAVKENSQDYLDKAIESFVQGFPESRAPPVFLPNNSVWGERAAMMLRTGHLLQYAAWKMKEKK